MKLILKIELVNMRRNIYKKMLSGIPVKYFMDLVISYIKILVDSQNKTK